MKTLKVLCDYWYVRKSDSQGHYLDNDSFQFSTGEEYEIFNFQLASESAYPNGNEQRTMILVMQNKKLIWVTFNENRFEIL